MSDQDWHLDKRIPIALILTMAGQLAVVAWGAAVMFKDIEANREANIANAANIQTLDVRLRTSEAATGSQAVQLGRIEEAMRGLRNDTNRMLNIIERQFE